jgi:hypothetical protein
MKGRHWQDYLVYAGTNPQAAAALNHLTFANPGGALAIFPQNQGLYPLRQFCQCEVLFAVWSFPTNATYVGLTYVSFKGFLNQPDASAFKVGEFDNSAAEVDSVYAQQVIVPDATNLYSTSFRNQIRVTSANVLTFTNTDGTTYTMQPRYSFPCAEDYFGFLIDTDGQADTGQFSLAATLIQDEE